MRSGFKKTACAVLAAVLAFSLCGCDRGYIMTVDGMDIRNGVYLMLLRSEYSEAKTKYSEETSAAANATSSDTSDDTTSAESLPITDVKIEGKNGSQWIKDEAMLAVLRHVAVQRKCEEYGIKLTDEELKEITDNISENWDAENQYLKYIYGYSTLGEYYESQGISKESVVEVNKVNELQTKLFEYYYGEGGELAVDQETFTKYLKENYSMVKLYKFTYTDAVGNALESDEDKSAVKEKAQAYADRLNNGESAVDLFYEIELSAAEEYAKAKAETDYEEDNEDGLSKEEWIKKQIEAKNVTKKESDDDLNSVVEKSNAPLEQEVVDYIFDANDDGKASIFATDGAVYLVEKADMTKQEKWLSDNKTTVLIGIKGDEYQNMLDIFAQNYEVKADNSLINNKYGPEKLNEE